MRVRGELHCCHCGYIAATVEMPQGPGSKIVQLIPSTSGPGIHRSPGQPPRCGRCDGPLFLEEVEAVRPKIALPAVPDVVRPGRPRRIVEPAYRPSGGA